MRGLMWTSYEAECETEFANYSLFRLDLPYIKLECTSFLYQMPIFLLELLAIH